MDDSASDGEEGNIMSRSDGLALASSGAKKWSVLKAFRAAVPVAGSDTTLMQDIVQRNEELLKTQSEAELAAVIGQQLLQEKEEMEKEIEDLEQRIDELEGEKVRMNGTVETLNQQIRRQEKQIEAYQNPTVLEQLEEDSLRELATAQDLRAQVRQATLELKDVRKREKDYQKTIEELENEVESEKKKRAAAVTSQMKSKLELNRALRSLEAQPDSDADMDVVRNEAKKLKQANKELEEKLQLARAEAVSKVLLLNYSRNNERNLQEQLQRAVGEIDSLRKDLTERTELFEMARNEERALLEVSNPIDGGTMGPSLEFEIGSESNDIKDIKETVLQILKKLEKPSDSPLSQRFRDISEKLSEWEDHLGQEASSVKALFAELHGQDQDERTLSELQRIQMRLLDCTADLKGVRKSISSLETLLETQGSAPNADGAMAAVRAQLEVLQDGQKDMNSQMALVGRLVDALKSEVVSSQAGLDDGEPKPPGAGSPMLDKFTSSLECINSGVLDLISGTGKRKNEIESELELLRTRAAADHQFIQSIIQMRTRLLAARVEVVYRESRGEHKELEFPVMVEVSNQKVDGVTHEAQKMLSGITSSSDTLWKIAMLEWLVESAGYLQHLNLAFEEILKARREKEQQFSAIYNLQRRIEESNDEANKPSGKAGKK